MDQLLDILDIEFVILILIENVDCVVGCEKNWNTIYFQSESSKFEPWILGKVL